MKTRLIFLLAAGVIGALATPVSKQTTTSDNKNPLQESTDSQTKHEESTSNNGEQKNGGTIDIIEFDATDDSKDIPCDGKVDIVIEETVVGQDDKLNLIEDATISVDQLPQVSIDQLPQGSIDQLSQGSIDQLPHRSSPIDQLPSVQNPIDQLPSVPTPIDQFPPVPSQIDQLPSMQSPADLFPPMQSPIDQFTPMQSPIDLLPPVPSPIDQFPLAPIPVEYYPSEQSPINLSPSQSAFDLPQSPIDLLTPELMPNGFEDDFPVNEIPSRDASFKIENEIMETAAGFVPTPLVFRRRNKQRRRLAARRHFRPNPYRRKFHFFYPYYGFYRPSSLRFY